MRLHRSNRKRFGLWSTPARDRSTVGVDMPAYDDEDEFDDRDSHSSFRRRLGEGLAGLLDPEGALGKSRGYVTELASGTKSEIVRMVSAEVRSFLDGMDTVDLMQQVIAGLVIDVEARVKFSLDPEHKKLQSTVETRKAKVSNRTRPEASGAAPAPPEDEDDDDDDETHSAV